MSQSQTIQVDGVEVVVEGQGPRTVVMIHGWPDTLHLWDAQVASLRDRFRCARFTLPGYDLDHPPRPLSLDDMVAFFARVIDTLSPGEPVILMLHDWGCIFGYEYIARYPQRVERVIGVDIGDWNSGAYLRSLKPRQKAGVAFYQLWLALAWGIGRRLSAGLGNRMTRWMARLIGCPSEPARIGWQMNYPYVIQWTGAHGSYRHARKVDLPMPMLYLYGRRKPFMFHSPQWLQQLRERPGCEAHEFDCGHWVMSRRTGGFNDMVNAWLAAGTVTSAPPVPEPAAPAPATHRGISELLAMARSLGLRTTSRRFYFLRHGQTACNARKIFQHPDEPLDETGLGQAREAAQWLDGHDFTEVAMSTMPRAVQTARTVSQPRGIEPRGLDELRERYFGEWIGSSSAHIDWTQTPGGGESLEVFVRRTRDGLQRALDRPATVLVVAHGGTLYVLAGLLGIELNAALMGNALPIEFVREGEVWSARPLAAPRSLNFNLS